MNYDILIPAIALAVATANARQMLCREFTVAEGFTGLLYRHGKFVEALAAGRAGVTAPQPGQDLIFGFGAHVGVHVG